MDTYVLTYVVAADYDDDQSRPSTTYLPIHRHPPTNYLLLLLLTAFIILHHNNQPSFLIVSLCPCACLPAFIFDINPWQAHYLRTTKHFHLHLEIRWHPFCHSLEPNSFFFYYSPQALRTEGPVTRPIPVPSFPSFNSFFFFSSPVLPSAPCSDLLWSSSLIHLALSPSLAFSLSPTTVPGRPRSVYSVSCVFPPAQ